MFKKFLSLFVCICVVLSCMTFCAIGASAAAVVVAKDYFTTTDYNTTETTAIGYNNPVTADYTGWGSKWLSSLDATDAAPGFASGKVQVYAATVTTGAVKPTGQTLKYNNYNGLVYRKLAKAVAFSGADAQYSVSFKISDGISTAANRYGFKFLLGSDDFYVGYDWVADENETKTLVVPYVKIGENKISSEVSHSSTGAWNAPFKSIVVSITIDADGDDTVKLKMLDDGVTSADWEVTATADLSQRTLGYIAFGGANSNGASASQTGRVAEIEISDTTANLNEELYIQQARAAMPGYEAVTMIDAVTTDATRAQLVNEYNAYGFAYDQMNNARYAALYEANASTTDGYGIKWGAGASLTVDGGAGWNGGWTQSRFQGTNGTIYPNVYISKPADSYVYCDDAMDGYAMLLQSYSETVTDGYEQIARKLNTPVNLNVDGEYFVKLTGTWNQYNAMPQTQLEISLGNAITFGSGCTSTAKDSSANAYTPMIKVGSGAADESSTVTLPRRDYYDYILRIVSHADEADTYEMFVCDNGTFNSSTEPVYSGTFESDASIDTVSIKVTCGQFAIHSVAVDCFNAGTTGNPFTPDSVRAQVASAKNYAAAKAIVDALPTCAAAEYLQAKALLDFEYIEFVSFQFDKGTTATPITNIDDYEKTMTTYKFRCVPEIKNNFKTKKDLNVFMVLYDGDKYVTSKRHGSAYEPGQTKKLYLGFDANYYMPSGIEEPIVKVFVWDYTTFTPYVAPKLIQKSVVDAGEH